jgi:hypothetical protein
MATVIIIQVIIATIVSLFWVRAIDKQIEDEQNEIEEWDVTLNDGLEDEMVPEVEEQPTTTDEPELPFVDTTMPEVEFQGSHRVTLTMNGSETAPIIFTPEMLREIKQRENEAWGRYNN